jgi:hypothetical protein
MPSERMETPGDTKVGGDNKSLLDWLRDAERSTAETKWREVATEDYKFYAGDQDTEEVKIKLNAKKKPTSTYNEVKPKIDMLYGIAAKSKYEPEAFPIGKEDEPLTEILNGALKHYAKKVSLPDKELSCFLHTIKAGRSLLYFYIDKENPFKPKIACRRFSGYNFYLDPDCVELDLSDARYLFLDVWLTLEEIKIEFPGVDESQVKEGARSTENLKFFNEVNDKYRIVEGWYYKMRKGVWFINPMSGEPEFLTVKEFNEFAKVLEEGVPVGQDENGDPIIKPVDVPSTIDGFKKIYYYSIFTSNVTLAEGESAHNWEGFPAVLYGAYKDDNNNNFFGAITSMKDPQRSQNDMRRQLSGQLKSLPKGLPMFETGVVLNLDEYEEKSTSPNFYLEIAKGRMDGVKFQEQPSIPPIYKEFDAMSSQSMKDVSGIQDSLMSVQTSSREAGVTVRNRQETGITVLYLLFDNLRKSRIKSYKILLSFIQQYITDEEIIRVQGEKGLQLMEINSQMNPQNEGWNDISVGKFDIEMSDTLETATMRVATGEMIADFSHNQPGIIPPDIFLDYIGLPWSVKQKVAIFHEQQREQQALQAEHDRKIADKEIELKEREVEIKEMEAKARMLQAKNSNKKE